MDLYVLRNNYSESNGQVYCDLTGTTVRITITKSDGTSYTKVVDLEVLKARYDMTDLGMYPICLDEQELINAYDYRQFTDRTLEEALNNSPIMAGILVPSMEDISSYCVFANEHFERSVAFNTEAFTPIAAQTIADAFPKLSIMSMGIENGIFKFRAASNKSFYQKVYCSSEIGQVISKEIELIHGVGFGEVDVASLEKGSTGKLRLSFNNTPSIAELTIIV